MLGLALYGTFNLLYWGLFNPFYTPSPLGLLILSFIVSIFILCSYYTFGRIQPKKVYTYVVAGIMIIVFLIFIVFIPNSRPFPNNWENNLHVIANIWTHVNLSVLGFSILIKKKRLPSLLLKKANKFNCDRSLTIDLNIASQSGIVNQLSYIADESRNNNANKFLLFRRALKILRNDMLYFNYSESGLSIDSECLKKINKIINDSNFRSLTKIILHAFVNKKPRANISKFTLNDILTERIKAFKGNLDVKRFIDIGLIVRKKK